MKFKKKFLFNIALAFLISSFVAVFSGQGFLQRLESAGTDFLFRVRGPSPFNPHVVVIEVDDTNISEVGRWPWNREWHAALTKALKDLGARAVYFDIIFSEASVPAEDDQVFAAAIGTAGNVYLPFAFQDRPAKMSNALFPIESLRENTAGTGSINIYPDIDGAIRYMPLFFVEEGKVHPHVSFQMAMDYLGMKVAWVEPDRIIITNETEKIEVPIVKKKGFLINWYGTWKHTFTHYSYLDVLVAYKTLLAGGSPRIDLSPIRGSICLVGVTAIGLYDIRPTPLEPEYPGIGAIATTIGNILDRNFVRMSPKWLNYLFIYLLGLTPFLFISGEKSLREILLVILVGVFYLAVVVYLFERGNYLVNFTLPLLSLVLSYSSVATFQFVRVSVERQQFFQMAVTDGLTGLSNIRYFMMLLNAEYLIAQREPEDRVFCVIMTDIDHFKQFNDTYGHAVGDFVLREVAKVLKESTRSSDLVARYGGEEMIILLRATSLKNALTVAEKIRKNIDENDLKDDKNKYHVTISLGVSMFQPESDTVEMLVKRADTALYKAKEGGRNRVETLEETPKG